MVMETILTIGQTLRLDHACQMKCCTAGCVWKIQSQVMSRQQSGTITSHHNYPHDLFLPDNGLRTGLGVHGLGPVDGHHQGSEAAVVDCVDICPSLQQTLNYLYLWILQL